MSNFHPLGAVGCGSKTQLGMGEKLNYLILTHCRANVHYYKYYRNLDFKRLIFTTLPALMGSNEKSRLMEIKVKIILIFKILVRQAPQQ